MAHSRSVLGPNEMRVFDASLRVVDGLGLDGRDMVAIVDLVAVYVGGAARGAVEALQAPGVTGQTDDEWWLATGAHPRREDGRRRRLPDRHPGGRGRRLRRRR